MKITRERFTELEEAIRNDYETYFATTTADKDEKIGHYVATVLRVLEIKVEAPPVMPEFLDHGEWEPARPEAGGAYWEIKSPAGRIASRIYSTATAKFLAGSNTVTEKVIAYLEWLAQYDEGTWSDEAKAMIDALEDQGCDVSKFRDE